MTTSHIWHILKSSDIQISKSFQSTAQTYKKLQLVLMIHISRSTFKEKKE